MSARRRRRPSVAHHGELVRPTVPQSRAGVHALLPALARVPFVGAGVGRRALRREHPAAALGVEGTRVRASTEQLGADRALRAGRLPGARAGDGAREPARLRRRRGNPARLPEAVVEIRDAVAAAGRASRRSGTATGKGRSRRSRRSWSCRSRTRVGQSKMVPQRSGPSPPPASSPAGSVARVTSVPAQDGATQAIQTAAIHAKARARVIGPPSTRTRAVRAR